MEYVTREFNDAVEKKWKRMKEARLGAVSRFEPKILWLKMLEGDGIQFEIGTLRGKFNGLIEQVIKQEGQGFILESPRISQQLFDWHNSLTQNGRISFWRQISDAVYRFDNQEETDASQNQIRDQQQSQGTRKRLDFD